MSLREAVRTRRGLRANRLRSALTMLGIVIGVAAVILLVAIGNGVQSAVNEYVEPLANLITIVPTVGNVPGGTAPKDLIDADVSALQNPDRAPDVASVTPASTGQALIETDTTESRTSVVGSTDRWLEVNNRDLQTGSFFDETQVRSTAKVVVLGPTAVDNLFGGPAAALGQTVRVNRQDFRVIGVMDSVGEPGDNVAAISLVVGGIGVLNIMLVSVTERTREIGIRKAVGATRRAIVEQFLIESIILASLGGAIGVLVGIGLSELGATIAPAFGPTFESFAPAVTIPSIVVSFAISLAIGLIVGGYPASRAAGLLPAEALRYE